jgi:putative FmdB family regulatory protein
MPTYNYKCNNCGHSFEKFQSMSSGSLRKCPKCKKHKLKRLIGAGSGIIFKGSGFYVNDYAKKKPEEKLAPKFKKGPAKKIVESKK